MLQFKKLLSTPLIAIPLLAFSLFSHATDIKELQKSSLTDQQQSQQAQVKINKLDEQKRMLIEQVKALQAESESLEVYNQYLARLLADQDSEKLSIAAQIKGVAETRQGLVPLMMSMLDNLSTFIALDAPFLPDERQQRLVQLQAMMDKADVSDAEKFRRLLTAYHIEAEYGSKMGQYQGDLTLDGVDRTVNYFYLGRVVFVAVSLDSNSVWLWDRKNNNWMSIDSSYARDINKAIRIAQKTDIPALLKLPLLSEAN
ncbi:DUF3450 domain-containing protein [Psychromonas marina]|uniref:DUF3450 domain-containing protein n=1 Tax=Psychromonas marina TaxID=88364 RepID=A0ABQ6E0L2_9GAMM|nr:DUF3450 domain-containing protein [Psychromonas marina]GLS90986.1 DUF3450 domain-containing protein [Psychromonas marina]